MQITAAIIEEIINFVHCISPNIAHSCTNTVSRPVCSGSLQYQSWINYVCPGHVMQILKCQCYRK